MADWEAGRGGEVVDDAAAVVGCGDRLVAKEGRREETKDAAGTGWVWDWGRGGRGAIDGRDAVGTEVRVVGGA
jgi:hypothetical protein